MYSVKLLTSFVDVFCRNVSDTKPNARYISLNGMFNSMRHEDENMHRLRHDTVFDVSIVLRCY